MGVGPSVLEDKYFLQKVKLGQGSFGTVWKGVERASGKAVAVKQMDKAQLPRRGVKREDIEREVSVMKAVHHENILQLYDFCEDRQFISFVLEYCDGGDFGDKVKERSATVTEEEAQNWMMQMLRAIQALHQNDVCHRDIKPDNFMVSKEHGAPKLKLADFGLATILVKGKALTEKCGTPAFMAPEQMNISKSHGYNHSVDVWAAGITMFMLISGGKHPFVNNNGQLDEKRLQSGELDFAGQGLLGYFQQGKFSQAANAFCKRMVEPKANARISAERALLDPWVRSARSERLQGDMTRRDSEAAQIRAGTARTESGGSSSSMWPMNIWQQGISSLFGDEQNTPPPGSHADQVAKEKQLQAVTSQIDVLSKQRGILQENGYMKNRIQELENQQKELRIQLQKSMQNNSAMPSGYGQAPGPYQPNDVTRRECRKETVQVHQVSAVYSSSGKLMPETKVQYNSTSAGKWLRCKVESFNEANSTYNLDIRPQADLNSICPDPSVRQEEAWPPGTPVSYISATAGRPLDARIISFVEGTGGFNGTYNLDVRECADCERIRARI